MQAKCTHALVCVCDDRFVRNRWIRIGRGAWRLGRILACLAVHSKQLFGLAVPVFQIGVTNRPRHAVAIGMFDTFEITLAKAEHCRAINFGMAADEVELPRAERLAVAVVPDLASAVALFDKDRFRTPVLGFSGQAFSAFQNENFGAGGRERKRDRASTYAGADDDHIVVGVCSRTHAMHLSVSGSKHTSLPRSTRKRASCPGFSCTSGSSRTVNSLPPRSSTASVSAPVGSITSTRASSMRSVAFGAIPSRTSLTASARMPANTSLPA